MDKEKTLRKLRQEIEEVREKFGVEFAEVKHGRWVTGSELNTHRKLIVTNFLYCSVCGEEAYWDTDYGQQQFNYCPFCGADMRGECL